MGDSSTQTLDGGFDGVALSLDLCTSGLHFCIAQALVSSGCHNSDGIGV
jgi:hypothetical protein